MTRFYNILAALAVVLTPVAMMAALGWSIYAAVLDMTGIAWLAVLSGLASAAALEVVGIIAGETTLWFHGRADRRWLSAGAVLAVYVAVGLVTLRGTALAYLPVLAGAVYVLVGLRAQAQRETAAEVAQAADSSRAAQAAQVADAEWKREQWRIQQADRTRLRLAEVEALAQSQHRADRASTERVELAQSQYKCEDCGRTFATVQAINAHRRHCTGMALAAPERLNGKVNHE